jgi:hypothetical protein
MAKQCYFDNMKQMYGDNWFVGLSPDIIQKQSNRIFKEMVKGYIDYEKYGNYFLDGKLTDNLIISANNELEVNTLLLNALSYYSNVSANMDANVRNILLSYGPTVGTELTHLEALCKIYTVILDTLKLIKETYNIGYLANIATLLYNIRNHI